MMRRKVRITVTLLAAALVGALTALGCADRIILGENHDAVDPAGAQARTLRANGHTLEYWVARSPGLAGGSASKTEAIVLFFVGKADRADRWLTVVAGAWGDRPVEVWGMNYPGS